MKMDFSPVQLDVLASRESLVVSAGAGSGKTRVLVEKYIRIFEENPTLKTDQVVAITFTEKAAQEMKNRVVHQLEERMGRSESTELYKRLKREMPFSRISTIHAFCSRLIRESTLYVDLDPDFNVVTSVVAKKRIEWVVESYVVEHLNEMVAFFEIDPILKLENIIEWFEEGVRSRAGKRKSDVPISLRALYEKHLEKILSIYREVSYKDSALDFEDLLIATKELLKENEELRERYSNYFRHIFVDEFQDTNVIQSEIIDLLRSNDNIVWYVGDPKQSIYAFRGARVDVFMNTIEESTEKHLEVKFMNENYRSKPNLVEFYNRFFGKLFREGKIPYTPQVKKGEDFEERVLLLENPYGDNAEQARRKEAESITGVIGDFIAKGYDFSDIAILLRRASNMDIIENTFFQNGIPFYTVGGKNFFRKTEVKALYNLFEVVLDPYNVRAMTGFLLSPFVQMSIQEVFDLKKKGDLFESLKEAVPEVTDLVVELNGLKNTLDASEILRIAMERTNLLGRIALEKDGDKRIANVLKFVEMINSLDVPSWDLRAIQRIMNRTLDANESESSELSENEDVVRIMTVHAAKGLEFPVVILAQMLSLSKKDDENEEEKRVLYVAMTRAKDYLVLSKENRRKNGNRGKVWSGYFESLGYIDGDRWIVPEGMEDLVKKVEFSPKLFKRKNENVSFNLEEELLRSPTFKTRKTFFNVTDLFENFEGEMDPDITVRGEIAHLILERVGNITLSQALKEKRVFPYPENIVKEVKEVLKKLLNDNLILEMQRASNLKSEFAVEGRVEYLDIDVLGKIDKVFETSKEIIIVDFKYSENQNFKEDYVFQVMLYMYLYGKLTGKKPKGVVFFLKDGKKKYIENIKERALMKELKKRVEFLRRKEIKR